MKFGHHLSKHIENMTEKHMAITEEDYVDYKGLKQFLKENPSPDDFKQRYQHEIEKVETNMSRCLQEDAAYKSINQTALDKIAKKYEKKLIWKNLRLESKATADAAFSIDARNRLIASAIAAAFAESSTLPIDTTKVRLQLQVTAKGVTATAAKGVTAAAVGMKAPQYTGMVDCFLQMARNEGVAGLWRGVTPALLRQVSYTSMTFTLFEPIRDFIGAKPRVFHAKSTRFDAILTRHFGAARDPSKEISIYQRFLAGGLAGAIGIAIMNPTEIVKTQMQSGAAKGSNNSATMTSIIKHVYRTDGVHPLILTSFNPF